MFKKLTILILTLLIVTANRVYVYADELDVPTVPDVTDKTPQEANEIIEQYNSEVDTYNEEVDKYNRQVDVDYEEAIINYNTEVEEAAEHNKLEDEKVAEVEAHNEEEDEKVAKSQEELAIIDEKIEADQPGSTVEHYTDDPEELPSDWSDQSEVLHTIKIEEAEEKSGEEVSIINLHLYLEGDQVPDEIFIGGSELTNDQFLLTDELKNVLLFAEWEVATFDLNDKVTVSSEAEVYKDGRIRHDGKNYRVQDYNANFIRNVEDYTQGTWMGGSEVASNSNTLEYGWGYDFDTTTGKGGETYTFEFTPEETTQYYLDNGELKEETVITRTIDRSEPKNILSIFTYLFQRIWDEPVEYEPDYQEYTPDYREEPEVPVKGEYLEKLEHMELIDIPEDPTPSEPTPEDPIPEEPEVPAVVPEAPEDPTPTKSEVVPVEPAEQKSEQIETIDIEDDFVPRTDPEVLGSWALFNLICSIITFLFALIKLLVFKRKEEDEENNVVIKSSYLIPMSSVVITVCSFYLFIITENTKLPMKIFDKFSPIMFILSLISLMVLLSKYSKKKTETEASLVEAVS